MFLSDMPDRRDFALEINPKLDRGKVFPVFIPFAGCPFHCIFCAQEKQTGKGAKSAAAAIAEAERDFPVFLEKCREPRADIAFYGGTFTAVAEEDFLLCLDFFRRCRRMAEKKGIVLLGRCSTRPDSLAFSRLDLLKSAGIDLIELGIQSFDAGVLKQSRRGYGPEQAKQACGLVKERGFLLGIQLMAGLPGQTEEVFLKDAETALAAKPDCMRYYPCLVPAGTVLGELYRAGNYAPWTDAACIKTLGRGLAMAWRAGVPVIRLTVAPEKEFDESLLAGPRHPALGSDIMAYALYLSIKDALDKTQAEPKAVIVPQKYRGCFFGTKKWLKNEYVKTIGLDKLVFVCGASEKMEISFKY